jgi:hypothetical protein
MSQVPLSNYSQFCLVIRKKIVLSDTTLTKCTNKGTSTTPKGDIQDLKMKSYHKVVLLLTSNLS